ncbi:MAG: YcgN family cysteine cluster protein [Magnetovibrio sp.]|nr:YcgN family cysteine cluster protein [Magnetovibrio sp.]
MAVQPVPLKISPKKLKNQSLKSGDERPFWHAKRLQDLSPTEWESLCDGCGRCCLEKLEEYDSGEISYTDVACTLLDTETCRCSNYAERHRFVPDCVPLNPENISELRWMPPTCAYRILAEGGELPDWHPLISGDPNSIFEAGVAVKGRCVPAGESEDLEDHIVTWPAMWPTSGKT